LNRSCQAIYGSNSGNEPVLTCFYMFIVRTLDNETASSGDPREGDL
jgi:hypothetical protein